jgi:hypothetical protein
MYFSKNTIDFFSITNSNQTQSMHTTHRIRQPKFQFSSLYPNSLNIFWPQKRNSSASFVIIMNYFKSIIVLVQIALIRRFNNHFFHSNECKQNKMYQYLQKILFWAFLKRKSVILKGEVE